MPGLREQKKAEKLLRIKEAAWELFAEQGFTATTTRAICQRAGIGAGTLFTYVEDKADLLVLVFEEHIIPVMHEALATIPDGCIEDRLAHVYGAFYRFYERDTNLGRTIVKHVTFAQGHAQERLSTLNFQLELRTAQLITDAQAGGEIADDAFVPMFAGLVFGAYFGVLTLFLNGGLPNADAATAMFRLAIGTLLDGVRPKSEAPGGG